MNRLPRHRTSPPLAGKMHHPMSRARRWFCAAVLGIAAPLWVLGLLMLGVSLAAWDVVAALVGRKEA